MSDTSNSIGETRYVKTWDYLWFDHVFGIRLLWGLIPYIFTLTLLLLISTAVLASGGEHVAQRFNRLANVLEHLPSFPLLGIRYDYMVFPIVVVCAVHRACEGIYLFRIGTYSRLIIWVVAATIFYIIAGSLVVIVLASVAGVFLKYAWECIKMRLSRTTSSYGNLPCLLVSDLRLALDDNKSLVPDWNAYNDSIHRSDVPAWRDMYRDYCRWKKLIAEEHKHVGLAQVRDVIQKAHDSRDMAILLGEDREIYRIYYLLRRELADGRY